MYSALFEHNNVTYFGKFRSKFISLVEIDALLYLLYDRFLIIHSESTKRVSKRVRPKPNLKYDISYERLCVTRTCVRATVSVNSTWKKQKNRKISRHHALRVLTPPRRCNNKHYNNHYKSHVFLDFQTNLFIFSYWNESVDIYTRVHYIMYIITYAKITV